MRIHAMLGVLVIAASAAACGGSDRTPKSPALDAALGAKSPSTSPPTARGGGPPDAAAAADALDELRTTPRPTERTRDVPIREPTTNDLRREDTKGARPPSPQPLPPDLGPPPPSPDVEWPPVD